MKKLVLVGMLSLLVLTGCGKKETVVCTQNKKVSGIEMNVITNIHLQSSRIKGIDMEIDVVVPETLKSQKNRLISIVESQYKAYEKSLGATLKSTETEDGAKFTVTMTDDQAKKFSGSKDKVTRKDVIEAFGAQEYECK